MAAPSAWVILLLGLGFTLSAASSLLSKESAVCLTSDYTVSLTCSETPTTTVKIISIEYGANADECLEDCCVDSFVICANSTAVIPQAARDECGGKSSCYLTSDEHLRAVDVTCGQLVQPADFARITYQCAEEETTTTTTTGPATTTTVTIAMTKDDSETTASRAQLDTSPGNVARDQERTTPSNDPMSSTGLIIGVSVAAAVFLIAVVIIVVVILTVHKRRKNYPSSLHVKTLASSDAESPGSVTSSHVTSEDNYGFAESAQNQRQRLQKRNEEIKRGLDVREEEKKKNKRPSKSSKSKSKKSSSQDKLNKPERNGQTATERG